MQSMVYRFDRPLGKHLYRGSRNRLVLTLIVAGGIIGGLLAPGYERADHYGGPLYDDRVERAYGIR